MKIFRLWKKSALFVVALNISSLFCTPTYGALKKDQFLFSSYPKLSMSSHANDKRVEEIKKRLSSLYHSYKSQIHFPLMNGIYEKSPQKVLLSLSNIQLLFQNFDETQISKVPGLKQLQDLSRDYLVLFQQLSNQELLIHNHYQQLHMEYITLLEGLSKHNSFHLFKNEIFKAAFTDFITQENQIAAVAILPIALNVGIGLILGYVGLMIFDQWDVGNYFVPTIDAYVLSIRECEKNRIPYIAPALYSEDEVKFYCSQEQEDIFHFEQYTDVRMRKSLHFYFFSHDPPSYTTTIHNYRKRVCNLALKLKDCLDSI